MNYKKTFFYCRSNKTVICFYMLQVRMEKFCSMILCENNILFALCCRSRWRVMVAHAWPAELHAPHGPEYASHGSLQSIFLGPQSLSTGKGLGTGQEPGTWEHTVVLACISLSELTAVRTCAFGTCAFVGKIREDLQYGGFLQLVLKCYFTHFEKNLDLGNLWCTGLQSLHMVQCS
jgi:hypothetical protein